MAAGEVRTAREAVSVAGVAEATLCRFRRSIAGKSLIAHIQKFFRGHAGQLAFSNVVNLMENAKSESARMRASEWVAGYAGIAPAQKSEVIHSGKVEGAGLTIVLPENVAGNVAEQSNPEPKPKLHCFLILNATP